MPDHPFRFPLCAAIACMLAACSPDGAVQAGPEVPLAPPTAYHLYVAANGADNNLGSESAPFLSIEHASHVALPGTTIHVAPGSYAGGFRTSANGTEHNRIYYISSRPGRARIVPPPQSTSAIAWDNRGDYIDIVGFDIDGSVHQAGVPWRSGLYSAGSYDSLRHNIVHHIATGMACTDGKGVDGAGAGITIESYFKGVHGEAIGNKLYDIGAADCPAIQGIAVYTSALVANNLIFRAGNAGIYLWHDANHVRVLNNTVAASNVGIVVGGGDFYLAPGSNDFSDVSNNIVFDNQSGIVESGATGRNNVYHNNLVSNNQAGDWGLATGMRQVKSLAADPGFMAYKRNAMPDLRLASNSAAIGNGDLAHAHPVDFNGVRRAAAGGTDIGALQH